MIRKMASPRISAIIKLLDLNKNAARGEMKDLLLDFTYGDIRAILKKEYTKGLKRTLLGSQSGIHELEQTIKDFKDDDQVTAEKFLQCVTITNAIVQKSLINPKNIAAKKAGTYKKKAHNRCSESLLDFFSKRFGAHYTQNRYKALSEAILHDDVDYVQWCVTMQSYLDQYQQYHDLEHHTPPQKDGRILISYFLYRINLNLTSDLALYGNEVIAHLIKHPNKDMYQAIANLPMSFFRETLITPPSLRSPEKMLAALSLEEIIKNTLLIQDHTTMISTLDWLFTWTSHPRLVLTKRDPFCSSTFMQAMLTNNRQILDWFTAPSAGSTLSLKIDSFKKMVLSGAEVVTLIEECEPEILEKYVKMRNELASNINCFNIEEQPEHFCRTLFLSAMKRKNIRILITALELMKSTYGVENAAFPWAMLSALQKAATDDPSLLQGTYGAELSKFFKDKKIEIDAETIQKALTLHDSTFFIWIINHEETWFKIYNENIFTVNRNKALAQPFFYPYQQILIHIANSEDSKLFNKLLQLKNFTRERDPDSYLLILMDEDFIMPMTDRIKALNLITDASPQIISNLNGYISLIELSIEAIINLIETSPAHEETMLKNQFLHAAFARVNLKGMQWLAERYPNQLNNFIKHYDFEAFFEVTRKRPIAQLDWLTEISSPEMLAEMIKKRGEGIFSWAIKHNSTSHLTWMKKIDFPAMINLMIKNNYNGIIHKTDSDEDQLKLVYWFFENTKEHIGDILQANRNNIKRLFKTATQANDLMMLKIIAEHAPSLLSGCIHQGRFSPFHHAHKNNQREIAQWLLEDPDCLAHAESAPAHYQYDNMVNEHIDIQIQNLHGRQAEHGAELTEDVFDVNNEREAKHAFYMLRALIRRNGNIDDINFLLTIPSVRALAHRAIGREPQENELLRLAMRQDNDNACRLLLEIDEVRNLAEANDFYQNDLVTTVNLRELAQNRESAMVALNAGEVHALDKAFKYYHGPITEKGIPFLIDELRNKIIETYEKNPAKIITTSGGTLELPATHVDFELLNLNQEDRQKALEAYHTHQIHGAYRFLCRPNLWMHPEAIFVERNANREGWASARCDNLIAMLYLAAIDENIPCIRDFTLETKWIHFLHELALINRGHNWDKSKNGVEYDDKEADRPSCGPGMERRLFQSVPGNPLLTIFTKDMLLQIIGSFAFQYFTEKLKNENAAEIVKVLNENIIELDSTHIKTLTIFNIPQEKYEELKNQIMKSFGDDFNSRLQTLFDKQFELETSSEDVLKHYHVFTLDGLSHFYDHLIKLYPEPEPAPEPSKPSETGLFAQKNAAKPEGDTPEKPQPH